jgi:hypothetical protein
VLNFLADVCPAERACLVGGIESEKTIFAVALDDAFLQAAKNKDFSAAFNAQHEVHVKYYNRAMSIIVHIVLIVESA